MSTAHANAESLTRYQPSTHRAARAPEFVREQLARFKAERDAGINQEAVWFAIPDERRAQLVALCTDRDTARAHMLRWADLTVFERLAIAGECRGLVRDLGKVAGLLK